MEGSKKLKSSSLYCIHWIPPGERRNLVLEKNQDEAIEEYRHRLLRRRNWAIMAASLATAMALVGLTIYEVRRPKINRVAIFTVVLAGLSAIGFLGTLKLNLTYIAVHVCVGSALAFAIAVTITLDAILEVEADFPIPAPLMLLILLVPYVLILLCSLVSTLLAHTILKIEEMAKAGSKTESAISENDLERQAAELQGRDVCCMCMQKPSTNAFVPCGHKVMCEECSQSFQNRFSRCPICRRQATSCIRIY